MKERKYQLIGLASLFGVKRSADVLKIIKEGCREVLGISDADFDAAFTQRPKVTKAWADGKPHPGYSSGGEGKSGRQWCAPLADALVPQWYATRDAEWLYSHPHYFWEGLACSWNASAPFITMNIALELKYPRAENKQGGERGGVVIPIEKHEWNILDWGAGCGLTTLLLAANFSSSVVYYNETNAEQVALFEWLLRRSGLKNVRRIDTVDDVPPLDMLVAIEIVEHFQKPIQAIRPLAAKVKPGGMIAHSSYWEAETKMPTLGHFLEYDFGWGPVSVGERRAAYTAWRRAMDAEGYDFLDLVPFQKRPRFWRKRPPVEGVK